MGAGAAPTLFFATDIATANASVLSAGGEGLLVIDNASAKLPPNVLAWPRDGAAIVDWLVEAEHTAARCAARTTMLAFARSQLIGESPVFRAMLDRLCRVTLATDPVLLVGPTGTGKELLARAIHYCGDRAAKSFAPVNCGAMPENLLESELFGHCSGAFTDARQDRRGLLAQAHGGTLFLDEVDALSLRAQVALLRFLQSGEYRPVGASKASFADTRIVAASNADLRLLVEQGRFRDDLYYRLAVLTIRTPRLADRGEDIVLIAQHFLTRAAEVNGLPARRFSPQVLAAMQDHDWPGNVRELENFVRRACVMADGAEIDLMPGDDAMPPQPPTRLTPLPIGTGETAHVVKGGFHVAKAAAVAAFERDYLSSVLAASDGNVTRAARVAGIGRRTFGRLAKRHGLRP